MDISNIGKALDKLERFSFFESMELDFHDVERGIFRLVQEIGKLALESHLEKRGTGFKGPHLSLSTGQEMPFFGNRTRRYLSIFGEIQIDRAYYWKSGCGCHPLDQELNLPDNLPSYLLQEWIYRGCTKEAYDGAQELLTDMLGIALPKRSLETGVGTVSQEVDSFHRDQLHQHTSPEGDTLVVEVDGKGIPMSNHKTTDGRLGRGEKRLKKKMAEIVTVQTVDSKKLKADRNNGIKDTQTLNKMAYGDLTNQAEFIKDIKNICCQRAKATHIKIKAFLADGQPSIWGIKDTYFPSYIGILDWYHMSEYLWKIAHLLYGEKTKHTEKWVRKKEQQLLDGKIETAIRSMQRYAKEIKGKRKRDDMAKYIRYFVNNKDKMRYDQYVKMGLPIGSGSVEGTCKHLIISRMEGCGMRWKETGAQAILKLRSVNINHLWSDFWDYYREKKRKNLYPNIMPLNQHDHTVLSRTG